MTDITIVGAGLVGATTALALANQNIRVRLIDAQPALIPSEKLDLRVVALNGQSIAWLKLVGIWTQLDPQRMGSFETLCIEDQSQTLCFDAASQGLAKLGMIIENNHIIATAQQLCLNHQNIQSEFSVGANKPPGQARGDSSSFAQTHLIIAADGAHSHLRSTLNIQNFTHDYHQNAWVCYVTLEKPHHNQAWQIFLPEGPLAFLPLQDQYKASIVWTRPHDATDFTADEITQASNHHYGDVKLESPLAKFPLRIQISDQYYKNNVVFLGDAIHCIHPLAGQGVNLGFADAQALTKLLLENKPEYWTNPLLLKKYQRTRKLPNTLMAHSLSAINLLFAQENPWLIQLRSCGVKAFAQSSTLKKAALSIATGLSDRSSL